MKIFILYTWKVHSLQLLIQINIWKLSQLLFESYISVSEFGALQCPCKSTSISLTWSCWKIRKLATSISRHCTFFLYSIKPYHHPISVVSCPTTSLLHFSFCLNFEFKTRRSCLNEKDCKRKIALFFSRFTLEIFSTFSFSCQSFYSFCEICLFGLDFFVYTF